MPNSERPAASSLTALITRTFGAMETLEAILARETEALRAGNSTAGLADAEGKAAAAAEYHALVGDIGRNLEALRSHSPAQLQELRRRHALFERILALNLAVLATTRSVSEGILREVSNRVALAAPQAYGPKGAARPAPAGAPISLSRST